jgi:hypothetical protein
MKEIYKNPMFYYIVVPILVALWPLLVWGMYLPTVEESWENGKTEYEDALVTMLEILDFDPDRLELVDPNAASTKFDYLVAVNKVAGQCRISAADYTFSSGPVMKTDKQESQTAIVTLKAVDMARFASFLSTIQLSWANLQCTKVKLTKKRGLPDMWKADLDFKYYY